MRAKIFTPIVFAILAGCQAIPKEGVPDSVTFTSENAQVSEILIPISSEITQIKGSNVDLVYGNMTFRNNTGEVSVYEARSVGDQVTVSKLKGTATKMGRITYLLKKVVSEDGGNLKVQLTPMRMDRKIPFDLMQWMYDPGEFTQLDLAKVVKNPTFHITFEVNTEYSVDSTSSNFKRLATPVQQYDPPVKEASGNITKQYYQLDGSKGNYVFGIEVFPYRGGSKTVIDSWISPIELENGIVSLGPVISDLKTVINKVVAN